MKKRVVGDGVERRWGFSIEMEFAEDKDKICKRWWLNEGAEMGAVLDLGNKKGKLEFLQSKRCLKWSIPWD